MALEIESVKLLHVDILDIGTLSTIPCFRHDDVRLEAMTILACHLCSFAHACVGRSQQAGTPEMAIRDTRSPCGIGRRSGMPWGRLIPRVGMLTTTGPLGSAQAGLHLCRSFEIGNDIEQNEKRTK